MHSAMMAVSGGHFGAHGLSSKQYTLLQPGQDSLHHRHEATTHTFIKNLNQDLDPQEDSGPVGESPEEQEIPPTVESWCHCGEFEGEGEAGEVQQPAPHQHWH